MSEPLSGASPSDPTQTQKEPPMSVPIYCLTKSKPSEEESLTAKIVNEDNKDLHWVIPEFIPWSLDSDGTQTDMLRIHKQMWTPNMGFFFFVDKQSLQDNSIIVTARDVYTLVYSDEAAAYAQQLVKEVQRHSIDYEIDEGLRDSAWKEFRQRALTYGRVPASAFRTVWANLDIANMDQGELVGMYGGSLKLIPDPEWDGAKFLTQIEGLKRQRDRDEL